MVNKALRVVFLALAAVLAVSAPRAEVKAASVLALEQLATFAADPIGIVNAGDGSGRLFVVLQRGQIMIYDSGVVLPQPFLDIRTRVSCCGEQGLLGLVFHPEYESNGQFYVNYTDLNGDTVLSRFLVSSDPDRANPGSEALVLAVDQPFSNHNGGQLQFGPDGYFYIGLGDGGSGGDPGDRAQNLGTLLGKMLRLDVDSDPAQPYTIPPTNPFIGRPGARPEIWALGLRNPWRFTFDRQNGDLFIADVGQSNWEEVNMQQASSTGGQNYGWRRMEGRHCFNPPVGCSDGTLTLPVIEYPHSLGGTFVACSVTGGYRYRGSTYPLLQGTYLYADFCGGQIWGSPLNNNRNTPDDPVLLDTNWNITSFGEDEAGELYLCETSTDSLHRIVDTR